jgi:hypothetical protein
MADEPLNLGPGITGHQTRLSRAEVVELVTGNARAAGCTCDPPHVIVPPNFAVYGEVARIRVEHDPGCPIVAEP